VSTPADELAVPAVAECENCGTALQGRFCHACGQEAEPPASTARGVLRSLAAELTNVDSRALRSVVRVLVRPGELTAEYLAGRRVRYTQPLQLYLGAATAFFFVNAYHPFVTFDPKTRGVVSVLNSAGASGRMSASVVRDLAAKGVSLEVFQERFEGAVAGYLPVFLVGSVLLFGMVLALFYRGARRGYLAHAVFALHWSAFYLLLMIVDRLIPRDRAGGGPFGAVLAVIALVYLAMALRRVHAESWLRTVPKAAGLFLLYQFLLSMWMLSAIGLAFAILT
jgi:ribosomal protein L32